MNNSNYHSDSELPSKIEAYLSEQLSNKERHLLEKAMLDDPFLADAVEGLALIADAEKRKNALSDIRKKLRLKEENIPLWIQYQKYAASVALILVFGVVLFIGIRLSSSLIEFNSLSEVPKTEEGQPDTEKETNSIEKEANQLEEDSAVDTDKNIDAEENQGLVKTPNNAKSQSAESVGEVFTEPVMKNKKPAETLQQNQESFARAELKESTVAEEAIEADEELSDNGFGVADDFTFDSDAVLYSSRSIAMEQRTYEQKRMAKSKTMLARAKREAQSNIQERYITGTVTDIENNPLPGVSISLEGTSIGTVTDIDGNFLLTASSDNRLLYINFVGSENEEVPLEEGDNEVKITIDEEAESLSEIVVTGFSRAVDERYATGSVTTLNRQELGLPVTVTYPSPKEGMKAFKEYIDTNLIYPKEAEKASISGKVKLGFTITAEGKVRDVEVLRSLGYGCDEEAIRLLKNGPDWFPKTVEGTPEDSERTIKIQFK